MRAAPSSRRGQAVVLALVSVGVFLVGVVGLGVPINAIAGEWVGFYRDGLGYEVMVRTAHEAGWTESVLQSDRFGWPGGRQLEYAFSGEYSHLYLLKALSSLIGVGPAMNAYLLAGFPLALLTAFWFARRASLGWATSLVVGILFALLPYHFLRAMEHYLLGMIWLIPLGLLAPLAVIRALPGQHDVAAQTGAPAGGVRYGWLALVSFFVGVSGVYYALFTLLVWVPTAAFVLSRRPRAWTWAILPLALVLGVVAALAPSWVFQRQNPPLGPVVERAPVESVINAGSLVDLFDGGLPGLTWEGTGFGPAVLMAAIGVLGLAVARFVLPSRAHAEATTCLVRWLALTSVWLSVWWVQGGFGYVFAVTVSPQIRSWGRLTPFVALLVLVLAAVLLTDWICSSRVIENRVLIGSAVGLVAVGLGVAAAVTVDGPRAKDLLEARVAVEGVVRQTQAATGSDCPLAHSPLIPAPEGRPALDSPDQGEWHPALTAETSTPTAQGALRDTRSGAWQMPYYYEDPATTAHLVAAVGFCAMVVDLRAYPDPDAVVGLLTDLLGDAVANDGTLASWRLDRLGPAQERRRLSLLHPPVIVGARSGTPVAPSEFGTLVAAAGAGSNEVTIRLANPADAPVDVLVYQDTSAPSDVTPRTVMAPSRAPADGLPTVVQVDGASTTDLGISVPPAEGAIALRTCALGDEVAGPTGLRPCQAG